MPRLQAKLGPNEVPIGDFENLSHYLQGYARLPTYYTPLLAAPPSRAAYARTLKTKAPADLFGGVLMDEDARGLAASYERLAATNQPKLRPPPASLADLPLVETLAARASKTGPASDTFAILLSGDGGWAEPATRRSPPPSPPRASPWSASDSLRYFWSARTPTGWPATSTASSATTRRTGNDSASC